MDKHRRDATLKPQKDSSDNISDSKEANFPQTSSVQKMKQKNMKRMQIQLNRHSRWMTFRPQSRRRTCTSKSMIGPIPKDSHTDLSRHLVGKAFARSISTSMMISLVLAQTSLLDKPSWSVRSTHLLTWSKANLLRRNTPKMVSSCFSTLKPFTSCHVGLLSFIKN